MPGNERQVERGVMKKQVATETSHWMERGHLEHTFHIKRREGHTLDGQGFSGGTMRVKESQRLSNATKRRNAVQSLLGILNLALLVTYWLVHSSEQRPCAFRSPGTVGGSEATERNETWFQVIRDLLSLTALWRSIDLNTVLVSHS